MWLVGVVVRRYIDFRIILIPTRLVSVLFYAAASLLFVHFKNIFCSCSGTFLCNNNILEMFVGHLKGNLKWDTE